MKKLKHTKRLLGLIGLAGTVGAMVPTTVVHATPDTNDINSLEDFWESMGLEDVEEVVTSEMLDENEAKLIKLSSDISNNLVSMEKTEESIKDKEETIKETQEEINMKEELHERRMEQVAGQAVSLQKQSKGRFMHVVEAVLNAEGLTDIIGRMHVITTLTEANGRTMELLKEEQVELEDLKSSLERDKKNLETEKNQLIEIQKELTEQREEAEMLQEAMEKQWENQEEKKAQLQAEQQRLAEIYEQHVRTEREILDSLLKSDRKSYTAKETDIKELASRQTDPFISHRVINKAMSYLGVPYVWGGATPGGFDCSGLVQYVYRDAGISLPRTAQMQSTQGKRVAFKDLEPGDLLFYGAEGSSYHVGIYVGGGKMLHAPKPGDSVKIIRMEHFMPDFAKRVLPENTLNLKEIAPVSSSKQTFSNSEMVESVFSVTYYSAYDGTQIGITAGGTNMANGNIHTKDGYRIVAVDPKVIPMGTIMRITTGNGDTFLGKADDTGGVIKGNKIDIAVSSQSEALRLGRTTAIIEILK